MLRAGVLTALRVPPAAYSSGGPEGMEESLRAASTSLPVRDTGAWAPANHPQLETEGRGGGVPRWGDLPELGQCDGPAGRALGWNPRWGDPQGGVRSEPRLLGKLLPQERRACGPCTPCAGEFLAPTDTRMGSQNRNEWKSGRTRKEALQEEG